MHNAANILNRRLLLASAATLGTMLLGGRAFSQQAENAPDGSVRPEELLAFQPLPDNVEGNSLAKVTVIEYASMTCGHCANFHNEIWPNFKKKFVESGQVRFVLREYPLDAIAAACFMLARSAGEGKFYPIVDLIFRNQKQILTSDKPDVAILDVLKVAGFTQERFEAILKNQKLYEDVIKVKDGGTKFGVSSTPTFFVNGQRFSGVQDVAMFEKIIGPMLTQ
jgi:protein-disulfide isomerase